MKKISAKNTIIGMILSSAMFSGAVLAQGAGADSTVKKPEAYGIDDRGIVARNTTGLCWRTGYWTPAMAIHECDPDLVKKPDEVAAAPAGAAAAADAGTTAPDKITFSADALFDFDSAKLKPAGVQSLNEFVGGISDLKYDLIIAVGYADRIGSDEYNRNLSLRRAEAVKAHLVSRGISPDRVFVDGKGEANPVTGNSCIGEKKTKALIDCLAPDRRVEIEVAGTRRTIKDSN